MRDEQSARRGENERRRSAKSGVSGREKGGVEGVVVAGDRGVGRGVAVAADRVVKIGLVNIDDMIPASRRRRIACLLRRRLLSPMLRLHPQGIRLMMVYILAYFAINLVNSIFYFVIFSILAATPRPTKSLFGYVVIFI